MVATGSLLVAAWSPRTCSHRRSRPRRLRACRSPARTGYPERADRYEVVDAAGRASARAQAHDRHPRRVGEQYDADDAEEGAHRDCVEAYGNGRRKGGSHGFVVDEFEVYLKCGILAHGFLRLRCSECAHEKLVAFSRKRRASCPSCGARRWTRRRRIWWIASTRGSVHHLDLHPSNRSSPDPRLLVVTLGGCAATRSSKRRSYRPEPGHRRSAYGAGAGRLVSAGLQSSHLFGAQYCARRRQE